MTPVSLTEEDAIVLSPCTLIVLAKDQPQYIPLPIAKVNKLPMVPLVSRWALSDADRAHIAAGGDLYLTLFSFGRPHMPVLLSTAPPVLADDAHTAVG